MARKGGGRWETAKNCRRSKLTAEDCHWVWGGGRGDGWEHVKQKAGGRGKHKYQGPRTATSQAEGSQVVVRVCELELATAAL